MADEELESFKQEMEQELRELTRWACVAFAARCARRVQPLFIHYWPDAPQKHVEDIDAAINFAIGAAAAAAPASRITVDAAFDAARAARARATAYDAASAAYLALVVAIDVASSVPSSVASSVPSSVASVASDVARAARAAAKEFDSWVVNAMAIDLKVVKNHVYVNQLGDTDPVLQEVFGAMWPEGEPDGWPIALESVPVSSIQTELLARFHKDIETIKGQSERNRSEIDAKMDEWTANEKNRRREQVDQLVKEQQLVANKIKDELENSRKEINELLEKTRAIHDESSISGYVTHFQKAENAYKTKSLIWGIMTVLFALITIAVFICMVFLNHSDMEKIGEIIYQSVLRFLIASTLTYMIIFCSKNFRIFSHMASVANHRKLAVLTFDGIMRFGTNEKIKDEVLASATECIFSPMSTGLIGKDEAMPHMHAMELVKEALSDIVKKQ